MHYEYVALQYDDDAEPWYEKRYVSEYKKLIAGGWEVMFKAPWLDALALPTTGVCIMRRPKDELRMCTEKGVKALAQRIAGKLTLWQLHASGWTEAQLASEIEEVLTRSMPESPISSEPRMWTEAEVQEIAKGVLAAHVNLSAM